LTLSGYDFVSSANFVFIPFSLLGIGTLINKFLNFLPLIKNLSLVSVVTIRPVIETKEEELSLSIVIPARNEKGNIENALKRIPKFGFKPEVIYVEGNSSDGTWEEILRVIELEEYKNKYELKAFQQPGKGKLDAVRVGFDNSTQELVTILDADLTMPPEKLDAFVDAYARGLGNFINGSRLVYPMEGQAMRPLNLLGNKTFAKLLSIVLNIRIGDSLCGTKLFSNQDYRRIVKWREDFGDFDPFGDFEFLFGGSSLKMGIIDVPIRYLDRTYGSTQISRFRDGFQLLKMVIIGFLKIKVKQV
jgi:glycosyltransferase involved in cell wall biosynthesis